MIGALAHLGARALDTVRAEVAEARSVLGWCHLFAAFGRGTPDPSEVEQLAAECDQLRAERDAARASLRELGGLLSGIARRMTDEEAEAALVEMAEASKRLAQGEAAAKALAELRAAASGLVAAEEQYQRATSAAEEAGAPLPLAAWIEGEEAWDRLVKALPPGAAS